MNTTIITKEDEQTARKNAGGTAKQMYQVGRLFPDRFLMSSWGKKLLTIESQREICRPAGKTIDRGTCWSSPWDASSSAGALTLGAGSGEDSVLEGRRS